MTNLWGNIKCTKILTTVFPEEKENEGKEKYLKK
jgi:hypothetical protein